MSDGTANNGRRRFLIGATTVVAGGGAVGAAVPFIGSWAPSAKAKAAGAPVKINIGKVQPGEMIVREWRGKPVYIVRRTQETLANLAKLDDKLQDPTSEKPKQPEYAKNEARAIKDEFLVIVGLCTHLGCAPKFRPELAAADLGADWLGGFFCPCHGSKFDLAGRVFKGVPAPENLEVPPYKYVSDDVIIVGEDPETA